jgi:hypothetical protein
VRSRLDVKNHFEPIYLIDNALGDDTLIRRDSRPPESIPVQDIDNQLVVDTTSEVTVRAVIVSGQAPDVVYDSNGDGIYSASDLKAQGFKLESNEVELKIVTEQGILIQDNLGVYCNIESGLFTYFLLPTTSLADCQASSKIFSVPERLSTRNPKISVNPRIFSFMTCSGITGELTSNERS